jgi:hypothetical protein
VNISFGAQTIVVPLLVLAVVGSLFAWAAWHAGRHWGSRGLAAAWIASAFAMTVVMAIRLHLQLSALGLSAEQRPQFSVFANFLPMWAVAFGAATLVIRARLRAGDVRFSAATVAGSLGALLAGIFGFFLVHLAMDFAGILGWS